jgi:hypothetical protein
MEVCEMQSMQCSGENTGGKMGIEQIQENKRRNKIGKNITKNGG